jgi:uncharacterized protein (TIGR02646 family)
MEAPLLKMIRLRPKPNCPALLQSELVKRLKTALERSHRRGRTRFAKFNSAIWLHDDVRLTLHKYQDGKCCYCERWRDPKREPDIEHFRPKAGVFGSKRHPGYWWLAYEWSNLFFSCKACNEQYKKTNFPLRRGGKRATRATADLSKEKPILPDLVAEDPDPLIGYEWNYELEEAWPIPRNPERGPQIIALLGLERDLLNEERGNLIAVLLPAARMMHAALKRDDPDLVQRYALEIRQQTTRKQQFAGFRRDYFKKAGLGQYIAND